MRIFAFHLLNDYSGSPKVLSQLLKGWVKNGYQVNMVTCAGREGFLSNIEGVNYHHYWYQFASNKLVRLFNFVLSQILLFFKLLFVVNKNDIVYINTILPFGAAFLAKTKGCRVIYHIHETSMKPIILKKILFGIVKWAADDVVYVSNFLATQEPINNKKTHIVYNAIQNEFFQKALSERKEQLNPNNVLMVCSLKDYKGVKEFVQLAKENEMYRFRLVVNASSEEIKDYFKNINTPQNLEIFPTQTNVYSFYQWADIILNLSRPDGWVETFGLTIIEGMAYGLPAIVPPVGGVTELIEDNKNGFQVDSRNIPLLSMKLRLIFQNPDLYKQMRMNSIEKINNYSEEIFIQKSIGLIRA